MRRILLGGLGIALSTLARPAFAQNFPTRAEPPIRGARLGLPVAIPDSAPSNVMPAGLFDRPPTVSPSAPPPAAVPTTIGVPPAGGSTTPLPLPGPRALGEPNLTEIRGPVSGGVPAAPGTASGIPSTVPSFGFGETQIPSLMPDDYPVVGVPGAGAPPIPALNRQAPYGGTRWWTSAEYLMWWTRSTQLPTLVTTGPVSSNGILGAPGTVPVVGGSFDPTLHGGARFGAGWWFSDAQCSGIDTRFLFLFNQGANSAVNTGEFPLLARPFFNVNAPFGPFSEIVGSPGLAIGGVQTHLDNSLWGAEINYRHYFLGNACARLDTLVGFRYLNFTENLSITETFVRTPGSPMTIGAPAMGGIVSDSFRAANNFYGGQIGLAGEVRRGRWFVNGRSTIAFGTVNQIATIGGGQALQFAPGTVGVYQGGLLAVPGANIGSFSQNKFAVLPEVGMNLGYHITPRLRVFAGYNFLYLSNVLRASGTIDPVVDAARIPNFPLPGNPTPLTGVTRPAPQFHTTDLWAQGINFGMQWSW